MPAENAAREHRELSVVLVNHTSTISGAEISLLDLIAGLTPAHRVTAAVPYGPLANAARERGATVAAIPAIVGSLRLHPRYTPRTGLALLSAGLGLRRIAASTEADIVHANSIRAGLATCLASKLGAPRPLVHLRDCLPPGKASNAAQRVLSRGAQQLLANSQFTADCFQSAPGGASIAVVHNPVDLDRFDPHTIDRDAARAELGLGLDQTTLVVLAQITPWKGQHTAVHATRILRDAGRDVRLLIAGQVKFQRPLTRYDNDSYLCDLHKTVADHHLHDSVTFIGQTEDPPRLLRAADYALVPSWAEPWGRVVVEAMAMHTPVIATNIGGPTEVIQHRKNGLLVPPHQPQRWADAIQELTDQPQLREQIINAATQTAKRFHPRNHVEQVLAAYRP